jgi:3-oxoacyl-[acyl-carrier-protein] synthase II
MNVAITGWSCTSPFGLGRGPFVDGVTAPRSAHVAACEAPMVAYGVPAFAAKDVLGRKGTRTMDRLTALTITTVGAALNGFEGDRQRVGMVLGSSQGSLNSIAGFTRETLVHDRPDYVNPALFPNTVMNCAAGQTAIWHGLRGPNVTLSAGHLSSLAALRYAAQALRLGYGDVFLAGGAEEITPASAWAFYRATAPDARTHAPLAEGCAMFKLELGARTRDAEAWLLGAEVATHDGRTGGAMALARCIDRVLERAQIAVGDVTWIVTSGYSPELSMLEHSALLAVGDSWRARRFRASATLGNGISVANAHQVALLLALMRRENAGRREIGLVTALDASGNAGALLLASEPSGVEVQS